MMKRLFVQILFLFLLLLMNNTTFAQDDSVMTLLHDGIERTYHLFLPDNYENLTEPMPVAIGLHGSGGTGSEMADFTGLRTLANETGSIIVFPDGVNNRWSYLDIEVVGGDLQDDIGFISALIDEVSANYTVDDTHISVIGFSNGGLMALRLRCELDERLAGVAVIGATPTFGLTEHCRETSSVPTQVILGINDSVFPWEGYAEIDNGSFFNSFSATQTMVFLSDLNGCSLTPTPAEISADTSPVRVLVNAFNDCGEGYPFEMIALVNFGHNYPSTPTVTLEGEVVSLEAYIWSFLARFSNEN